jgi:hypothetical protein
MFCHANLISRSAGAKTLFGTVSINIWSLRDRRLPSKRNARLACANFTDKTLGQDVICGRSIYLVGMCPIPDFHCLILFHCPVSKVV